MGLLRHFTLKSFQWASTTNKLKSSMRVKEELLTSLVQRGDNSISCLERQRFVPIFAAVEKDLQQSPGLVSLQVPSDHYFPVDEGSESTEDGRDDYSSVENKEVSIIVTAAAAASISLSGSDNDEQEEDQTQDVIIVDDDNNSEVPVRVKTRKRKIESPVWEFAERFGNDRAKCKLCLKDFACPGSNTSNIRDHILNKHNGSEEASKLKMKIEENVAAKKKKDEMKKAKSKASGVQSSIKSFYSSSRIAKRDKEEIDDSVLEYLICDNASFETVESHFFRQMLFKANKSYVLPSRPTITRKIYEKTIKVKKNLTRILSLSSVSQ